MSAHTQNKYRNIPTHIDGIRFASGREGRRYQELKLLERAKQIRALQLQPRFPLHVEGHKICTYVADFQYIDCVTGRTIVEDSKGARTKDYEIKRKLFCALHPELDHREV